MANKRQPEGEKKFRNVGALWRTKSGSKAVKASGQLQMEGRDGETYDILLMDNDKDGNAKRPDFRIVIVEDVNEPRERKGKGGKQDKEDDDIPF